MKRKNLARASAAVLAVIMTVSGTTMTGFASGGGTQQVAVRSDSQGQMSSEPEVVYNNTYENPAIRTQNFDSNWKFYLGDAGEAQGKEFDDSKWESISIPHDYSIIQDYTTALDAESGYLPGGTGWYRKHFVVGKEMEGKELRLDFDGVYMNATVYVNGEKLGTHPYGYTPFSFDITDKVKVGEENVVAVKVDHKTPSSRWYSGSGIYRSVHLSVMDKVHVGLNGTKVETPDLKSDTKNVTTNINTTVQNEGTEKASVELTHNIFKKGTEESIGKVTTQAQEVEAGKSQVIEATVKAKNPSLWSPENPALYTVRTEVKVGGKVVDTYETEFGFRYFEMTADKGAYLNGEKIKLKGVCMHHDQGSLGSAAYRRAIERQVDILKEMGCNSIRVTHNPAASILIEICNEKGMLVIDEMFDGWMNKKNNNNNDYSVWFNKKVGADNAILGAKEDMTWAEFDLKATITRGQNAPSIIMWSLGNEIQEGTGVYTGYAQKAKDLIKWTKEADSTRMATIGSNDVKNGGADHVNIADQLTEAGGSSGTNYSNGGSYDNLHNAHPNWKLYGSETASAVNSRGIYTTKGLANNNPENTVKNKQLTSYDKSKVGWGALASQAWYDVITRDFVAGEYVWTGFDYIGEPTPWNGTYPGEQSTANFETNPKNSYFGIVDTAGFPKDSYYFYQSQWNDKVNTLHVLPTWNKDSIKLENGKAEVVVYSDAAKVELKLNGQSLGTKEFETQTTGAGYTYQTVKGESKNHKSLYMTWEVPYQEGTLEAIAYDKNGNKIEKTQGRSVVKTTGKKSNLSAKADRSEITADGKDLAYVEVDVRDADGNIIPNAEDRVTFKVEGNGELVGVDNGSAPDHDSYKGNNKRALSGKVLAIVRATKEAGEFTVTASADGLKSSKVTVKTVPGEGSEGQERQVDSYYMSKNYYVKKNVKPALAETIEVRYTDGTKEVKNVTWDKIPEDKLTSTGTFTVNGQVEGAGQVSVNVNVIDNVAAMLNYSTTVALGSEPNLPERRPVVLSDGEVLNTTFEVKWTDPGKGAYDQEGIVEVKGTAAVLGETLPVTASVRVQKASFDIGDSVSKGAAEVTQDCEQTSDSLEAINDGSTEYKSVSSGANQSVWSNYDNSQTGDNKAEITFRYDTTFALGEVVIHFARDGWSARYPDSEGANAPQIYVSETGADDTWVKAEAEAKVGEEVKGPAQNTGVKPYKYTFTEPYGAVYVKVCLTNKDEILDKRKPCTAITEIELKKANEKFIVNDTAKLESLTVNGKELDETALAKDVYTTAALVANLENVKGAGNAAVTVLPAYKNSVKLILESEDHATRKVFEIKLNSKETVNPEEENLDYPLDKLTGRVIAGDERLPGNNTEGPKELVIDDNGQTHWHTNWDNKPTPVEKRWVGFNFEEAVMLDGLRYLPRLQGADKNGRVSEYAIEYKETDDSEWTRATLILDDGTTAQTGTWDASDNSWKLASFEPVKAKQIRLVGIHTEASDGKDMHMSVAELRAKTVKPTTDISEEKNGIKVEVLGLNDDGVIEVPFIDAENPVTPAVKVTDKDGNVLEWGIDYKVSYENNTEFSADGKKAKVIVEGIIDYSGKVEKEFTIKKAPRELTGIFVKEMPEKIQYQAGENFNPVGLELTLVYNDKTEETVAYKGHEKDFEFSPALDQELKEADKKVTVTYGGKETVIDITVQPEQVTVTFIVDGKETPVKVVKGQSIGALMPKDPSKEGYTFKGWNTKKDGSGEVVTADTVVKEDLSVYAIFEKGGKPSKPGKPGKPGDSSDGGSQGQKPGQNGDASNGASNDKIDSVKTGDTANVIPFVILAVAAVAAILSILALKKRKK